MKSSALVVALALLAAACGSPATVETSTTAYDPETSIVGAAAELAAARQRWVESGLDTYWFRTIDDCGECDPSTRQPQTEVVWSGDPVGDDRRTVETLFAQIDDAIARGRNVEVSYHPDLGHPTEISIDMQDRAFDGGHHMLVEGLVPGLPGEEVSLDELTRALMLWEATRPVVYEFRTAIHCGCEIQGTIRTRVEDDRIVDWEVEFAEETGSQISPITIDMMFDDLAEMLSLAEGVETDGVRFTGSAAYHPEMGYPTWVGLDVEILDSDSELAFLPPRLVFSVSQLTPIEASREPGPISELEHARSRWDLAELAAYRYELRLHDIDAASFTDPYIVTVSRGEVVTVEHRGGVVDEAPPEALPMERLFDLIHERIYLGSTVDVLYHAALGYPVFVSIRTGTAHDAFSIHELTPAP